MKRDRESSLTLGILEAIDTRSDVTQRHLANTLGVALGLANSYLRRCVRKGLIKIQQAPANRYLYYLTPQGFAEKSRLTAEYLSSSFDYYNRAGRSMTACFREMQAAGCRAVICAGMSELAEIASVRVHDFDLDLRGTWDSGATVERFIGLPVWRDFAGIERWDAVLLTDLADTPRAYAALRALVPAEQLYVPDVLSYVRDLTPA